MLSTRQLRYFEVLAETLHFGRAAHRLNISQPALSAQIAAFEARIGSKLVERRPSGVVLTVDGAAILGRVQNILLEIRELETLGAARGAVLGGQLRIGIIATVAPYLLPRLLPSLSSNHADLQLAIRENLTDLLVAEIMAGELDCAILALPLGDPHLATIELGTDPFRLAVPARDVHRFGGAVDVGDLSAEKLILLEEGHCLRDQALKVCQLVETQRFADLSATSLATILRMVAGGLGATLIPEIAVEAESQSGDVEMLPFREPAPFRTLALAFRRSSSRRRTFDALAEIVRACLA